MAIRAIENSRRSFSLSKNKNQMTVEEFKKWLLKFDADKDGRISAKEFRAAVRSRGRFLSNRKSIIGMREGDINGSGYIDEDEIDELLDFAESNLGFVFYC